ncbi:hypothetical protein BOO28_17670 [Vibrio navarrensis]|nr:hypothetical protein [Vibrio navarrensis]MBE4613190.1 hypothetical protein [Vibrio navarrensis]
MMKAQSYIQQYVSVAIFLIPLMKVHRFISNHAKKVFHECSLFVIKTKIEMKYITVFDKYSPQI